MTILEMIKEWRKGCSCGPYNQANCPDCTMALIDAIEAKLKNPQGGRGGDYVPQSPLSEKEPGKYQIRSLWRVLF